MAYSHIHKPLILSLTLSLSGCMGIYEGGFECPPGEGTKCKSISEVNTMVSKGELPVSRSRNQGSGVREETESNCSCESEGKQSLKHPETPQIWWAPRLTERSNGDEGSQKHHSPFSKRHSV